jgi:hypothetical protein
MAGELNPDTREPLTQTGVELALDEAGRVLTTGDALQDGGMAQLRAFAELAGGPESYEALIAGSERFLQQYPDIFKGRAPAPEVMGLWIGLVAGVRAAETR